MESVHGWPTGGIALLAAYLLGSIPFGYILVRASRGVDIRQRGSGNIGATNVQRYLGTLSGALILVLDGGKGALAVWLASRFDLDPYWQAAAATVVVIGHCFPLFLGFRGGKGVATGGGAFAVLAPGATLAAGAVFLVLVVASRFVSLGSVGAAVSLPLFAGLWYGEPEFAAAAGVGLLVLVRHRDNIRNLLGRRERPLGGGSGSRRPGSGAGN